MTLGVMTDTGVFERPRLVATYLAADVFEHVWPGPEARRAGRRGAGCNLRVLGRCFVRGAGTRVPGEVGRGTLPSPGERRSLKVTEGKGNHVQSRHTHVATLWCTRTLCGRR